jgi:hypothetical protein
MAQTATLYIIEIKNLAYLKAANTSAITKKKGWLGLKKKAEDSFKQNLESLAAEKILYRWSGLAFTVLAVFSKEKLQVDWENLKYSNIANDLSKLRHAGIFIFSIEDEGLFRLNFNGMFYSEQDLNDFAIEFIGKKPDNPGVMKNAVEVFNKALSKLTKERVVLLLIV